MTEPMTTATIILPSLFLFAPLFVCVPPALAETPHASIGKVLLDGAKEGIKADAVGIQGEITAALKMGDKLYPGERISTGAQPVTILLREGTISAAVKLKAHTKVRLQADPGRGILAELEQGALVSDVHNPEKRSTPYTIRTHGAVMGVRGTVFYVEEQPGKDLFVCTCHGEVAFKSSEKSQEKEILIQGKNHDHPVKISEALKSSLEQRMSPAPVGDGHSDADAAELEKQLSGLI